ncbi:hypothetical protein [Hymenobacter sp. GOD-10R]|uniref:hypothetical protein n=1 Tax=Hymenobacter sp. GOD-10R TaxID=3093922 RepID=UPI002D79DA85|nr:hypothetical protein [Hymenobacter sp. GOD-10R]WRQ29014.1 hypothetical protein SD425_01895 [Hymenobacter sp. GOD-10R]
MKSILRAVGIGLLAGTLLFFFPFFFRFLLFVGLLSLLVRLITGGWRGRRFGRRGRWASYAPFPFAPVPIDGQWYRAPIAGNGPVSHVQVA